MDSDTLALARALLALHQVEEREGTEYVNGRGRPVTRKVCAHCAILCHSHSGLYCDEPADGLWPCDTIKAVQEHIL